MDRAQNDAGSIALVLGAVGVIIAASSLFEAAVYGFSPGVAAIGLGGVGLMAGAVSIHSRTTRSEGET